MAGPLELGEGLREGGCRLVGAPCALFLPPQGRPGGSPPPCLVAKSALTGGGQLPVRKEIPWS